MSEVKKTKYILHVSDFHLSGSNLSFAEEGLACLSNMLDECDITVDYLIHTGDVIDSKGAYRIAADDLCRSNASLSWIGDEYVVDASFDMNGFLAIPEQQM